MGYNIIKKDQRKEGKGARCNVVRLAMDYVHDNNWLNITNHNKKLDETIK